MGPSASGPTARRPLAPALQPNATPVRPRPAAPARAAPRQRGEEEGEEDWLLYVAVALSLLILALVVRKALKVAGALPGTEEL